MTGGVTLSIVIVNYNTGDYTAQCLDSIFGAPPDVPYEVAVVDNASSDGSADWLEDRYPEITLVRSPENRGIAGGNNMGIRAGTGPYVLLVNNDTLVLPGTINRVVAFLEDHPEAGGAGGQLLNSDGSFQSGSLDFPSLWEEFLFVTKLDSFLGPYYPSHPPAAEVCEVDWMSTAFMLFRREALGQVGLVDETFFIYSDETDLQYRLRKAGWKMYYLPDVKTIHFGGKSLTPWRRRKLLYRGKLLFFQKHYGWLKTMILCIMFAFASTLKSVIWAMASLVPLWRERARCELVSHLEILRLCVRLE